MLCGPYCDVCRAGIAYGVICKVFTLNDFHIAYNRWGQFCLEPSIKSWSGKVPWYSICISKRSLFLRCCDTNWHYSFVIHWMKSNFFWPQNCSNFLQSSNAGSCNLCRNMRWIFGILRFVKFDRCCVYPWNYNTNRNNMSENSSIKVYSIRHGFEVEHDSL